MTHTHIAQYRRFAVEDHVKLVCPHRTPDCTISAGETGTIIDIDPDDDRLLVVALHHHFEELRHCRNFICITAAMAERIV